MQSAEHRALRRGSRRFVRFAFDSLTNKVSDLERAIVAAASESEQWRGRVDELEKRQPPPTDPLKIDPTHQRSLIAVGLGTHPFAFYSRRIMDNLLPSPQRLFGLLSSPLSHSTATKGTVFSSIVRFLTVHIQPLLLSIFLPFPEAAATATAFICRSLKRQEHALRHATASAASADELLAAAVAGREEHRRAVEREAERRVQEQLGARKDVEQALRLREEACEAAEESAEAAKRRRGELEEELRRVEEALRRMEEERGAAKAEASAAEERERRAQESLRQAVRRFAYSSLRPVFVSNLVLLPPFCFHRSILKWLDFTITRTRTIEEWMNE